MASIDLKGANNSSSEISIKVSNKIPRTPPKLVKSTSNRSTSDVSNEQEGRSRTKSKNSPTANSSRHARSASVKCNERDRAYSFSSQPTKFSDRDRSNSTSAVKRKRPGNSQNDQSCGVCEELFILDDYNTFNCIACNLCLIQFHPICVELTTADINAITHLGDKIKWYCPRCNAGAANLHKANILFDERIGKVEKSLTKLDKSVVTLQSENKEIKNDIQTIKSNHTDDVKSLDEKIECNKGDIDENSSDIKSNTNRINAMKQEITTLNLKYDTLKETMLATMKAEVNEQVGKINITPVNPVDLTETDAENEIAKAKRTIDKYTEDKMKEIREAQFPPLGSNEKEDPNQVIKSQTYHQSLSNAVREEFNELEEIKRRKNQILIMNMKENNSTAEDLKKLHELFILLKLDKEVIITQAIRLGEKRRDNKPRFIRVTLQDLELRRKILAKATTLRDIPSDSDFAYVYIKPNLTKLQNEKSKNLQEDLRARRLMNQDSTKDFKISKGKIIEIAKNH